jgi:hypothetical protein
MSSLVLARGLAALLVLAGGLTILAGGLAALLVLARGLAALLILARALAIFTYMSGWASASSTYCCWGVCWASNLTLRATLHFSYTSCISSSPLTAGIITDLWYSIQYYWARLEGLCRTCISKRTKRCRGV